MHMTQIRLVFIYLTGLFLLSGCNHSSNEFSKAVGEFKDKTKGISSLYFYAGTLQMLNFTNDTTYNKLIKDVKKMRILSFKSDNDTVRPEQMIALANNIRKESFVDLMQVQQKDYNVMIFMQKLNGKPKEIIGIVYGLKEFFIVDLLGSIPMSILPGIINGNFNMSGLNSVLNYKKPVNPKKTKKQTDEHGDHP